MVFAHETPRLRFNAVEPGLNLATGVGGRDAGAFVRLPQRFVILLLVPFIKKHPKRAARVIAKVLVNELGETGIYYDEAGGSMQGSARDSKFQDRVVAETRALLTTVRA